MLPAANETPVQSPRAARPYRLAARRITRAHLSLSRRSGVVDSLRAAVRSVEAALTKELGAPVSVRANLLDGVFQLDRCLSPLGVFFRFEFGPSAELAILELDRSAVRGALTSIAGVDPGPGFSSLTRLEQVALSHLGLVVARSARNAFATGDLAPRLHVVADRAESVVELFRPPCVGIALELTGAVEGAARLFVNAAALEMALRFLPEDSAAIPELLLNRSVDARVLLAGTTLDVTELRALAAGDVVLLSALRLHGQHLAAPARLATSTFRLVGAFGPEGFSLNRVETHASTQELPMSVVDDEKTIPALPVEVEVELTRLPLPLTDLAQLKAGSILPLHVSAADPVVLRVGGRPVAKAELVEIDGEVGARILSLLA